MLGLFLSFKLIEKKFYLGFFFREDMIQHDLFVQILSWFLIDKKTSIKEVASAR